MSDRSSPNSRWLLNGNAQDPNVQQWELADELARMKINPDGNVENIALQTPPRSYPITSAHKGEGSPSSGSGKSSPPSSDHQRDDSHSRNSSIDTNNTSSHDASFSSATKILLGKSQVPHSLTPDIEHKERPHSFSGGLSTADLRRLQQAGEPGFDSPENQKQAWMTGHPSHHEKQASEQLSYPSLSNNLPRHTAQPTPPQRYEVRVQPREETQIDYNGAQRNYGGPIGQGPQQLSPSHQQHFNARSGNVVPVPYRQSQRSFPQAMASPTQMAYPNGQVYDLMMPGAPHEHPAVARVQQQHNVYPRSHHHSNSDPNLRDPATMALLNASVQPPFAPGIYQNPMAPPTPMHVYANQYFAGQEFPRPDVVAAQNMAARLQPQYTGQYGIPVMDGPGPSPAGSTSSSGPSANNRKLGLYKTELCRSWEEKGTCRYGVKCQFAHGEDELRSVTRHPKYKTEICRTFWVSGSCPYGKRCCFIHTELPANGNAAAPAGSDATKPGHSRERSSSTNSDPNDASSSLLARIRNQDSGAVTPSESKPATSFQILGRPTALRVDTALDGASMKQQNKSAFPSFASNVIIPSKDTGSLKSPAPVTAGPDIGRHNNFSYGNPRHKTSSSSSSIRHSFNGDDLDINFSPTPPSTGLNYAPESPSAQTPRGHTRAGSSGNWGSIGRASLGASSFPSAAAELPGSSPWSTQELAVGSSRLHEKAWN